jgi:N-acetylglutamate synthase
VTDLVRRLQERATRAFPALRLEQLDGWWLRHADGSAWWAGSVLPHRDVAPAELPDRIRRVEEFYAGHGARARFQISPGACPADLDGALAARGYRTDSPMSLRAAATARVLDRLPTGEPGIEVDDQPTDGWFGTERDMLRRVSRPSGYASVLVGAELILTGGTAARTRPAPIGTCCAGWTDPAPTPRCRPGPMSSRWGAR